MHLVECVDLQQLEKTVQQQIHILKIVQYLDISFKITVRKDLGAMEM